MAHDDCPKLSLNIVIDPCLDFKSSTPTRSTTPRSSFLLKEREYTFSKECKTSKKNSLLPLLSNKQFDILPSRQSTLIRALSLSFFSEIENTKKLRIPSLVEVHRPKFNSSSGSIFNKDNNYLLASSLEESQQRTIKRRNSIGSCSASLDGYHTKLWNRNPIIKCFGEEEPNSPCNSNSLLMQRDSLIPSVHLPIANKFKDTSKMSSSSMNSTLSLCSEKSTKSHVMVIPIDGPNGQSHILKEVHQYPPASIETVTENRSYIGETSNDKISNKSLSSVGKKKKKITRKYISNGSGGFDSTYDSLKTSFLIDSNTSFQYSDFSCSSSDASDLSVMSDLSVYGNEYSAIKKFVSGVSIDDEFCKNALSKVKISHSYTDAKLREQSVLIKELTSQKDDLEIQMHKHSIQLQNIISERDLQKQELEVMHMKMTDINQKQYFEVLKQKAAMDGQLLILNHELEACKADKICLQSKLENSCVLLTKCQTELDESVVSEANNKNLLEDLSKKNTNLEGEVSSLQQQLANEKMDKSKVLSELSVKNCVAEEQTRNRMSEIENKYKFEIDHLKKLVEENKEREKIDLHKNSQMEKMLLELNLKLESFQSTEAWYKDELLRAQATQSELQEQLSDVKTSLYAVTFDAGKYKSELDALNNRLEENRVTAVKEKQVLLSHLEEVEADMKEREAALCQKKNCEGDKISIAKEQKLKKLEDDQKRYQKIKIEMSDAMRHNTLLMDEVKHKNRLITKLEQELKHLRTDLAMTQESVGEKDVIVTSTSHELTEFKQKLDKSILALSEKDSVIATVTEQKVKLEALLKSAKDDKNLMDETVAKLKDDVFKLSSNFYKMKHDIAAKDKKIESLSSEYSELISDKEEIEKNLQEYIGHENELKLIKEKDIKRESEIEKAKEETNKFKRLVNQLEAEKNACLNSINLRDLQIKELLASLEKMKENLSHKDKDLEFLEKSCFDFEGRLKETTSKCTSLYNSIEQKDQVIEDLKESEKYLQKQIAEHEQSYFLERRKLEKRYVDANKKLGEYDKVKLELDILRKEQVELEAKLLGLNNEIEKQKKIITGKENEVVHLYSELEKRDSDKNDLLSQINIEKSFRSNDHEKLQKKYNEALTQITTKSEEISNLKLDIEEKSRILEFSENTNNELIQQKECLDAKVSTLYQLQKELEECRKCLQEQTEQCSMWQIRYESLRDIIPEKDTNSHNPASTFTDSHPSSLTDANNASSFKFDETLSDLQRQFGLTTEVLQSKDEQIIELTGKVEELQSKLVENENISYQLKVNVSHLEEDIRNLAVEINELKDKLHSNENTFKDKEKQYESNIHLLTQKLKEHMKGRRQNEKQLELMTQENERTFKMEKEKQKELLERCIQLEKELEYTKLALNSAEIDKNKTANLLDKETKTNEIHCQTIVELETKLGYLNELEKLNTEQKMKIASLEDEIQKISIQLKESRENIFQKEKDLKILKGKMIALQSKLQKVENNHSQSESQIKNLTSSLNDCERKFQENTNEIINLKDIISKNEIELKEAKESHCVLVEKEKQLIKLLDEKTNTVEELQHLIKMKNNEVLSSQSKIDVLEQQIKLLEQKADGASIEITLLLREKEKAEADIQAKTSSLESQLTLFNAREASLNHKIEELLQEKLYYQTQVTEQKKTLNSALSHIKKLKNSSNCMEKLPSPPPIDSEALKELLKQCTQSPKQRLLPLESLSRRVSSLREELSSLQPDKVS